MDSMACRNFEHRMARYVARMERRSSLRARQQFDLKGIRPLDGIAANSEFTRDNIQAIYGQAPVRVIPPVVRIPPRIMARQGLDRTGLQVLVHSRLEVSKNIDTVLRGFALFRCRQPGARLHVVGEGRNRAALEALARELLPEGGCQFHGVLPEAELQRVYEACQVMVTLPLDEPFGMVLPEAAVQGLLLVGSDHGGNLEILDGGRLGWAVDPFAPESLEEALVQISALSDGEADRRRQAADLACRNRYTLEVIGPQLSAFLQG
jgi:glycosyltransferase involved in cell wall biosynthesis